MPIDLYEIVRRVPSVSPATIRAGLNSKLLMPWVVAGDVNDLESVRFADDVVEFARMTDELMDAVLADRISADDAVAVAWSHSIERARKSQS